jgi:hypothetical protein
MRRGSPISTKSTTSSVGFDRYLAATDFEVRGMALSTDLIPAQVVPIGVSISVQVTVEWEVR